MIACNAMWIITGMAKARNRSILQRVLANPTPNVRSRDSNETPLILIKKVSVIKPVGRPSYTRIIKKFKALNAF